MELKYKYIHFVKTEGKPKTSVWECRNNSSGHELGVVKWNSGWRQYCYFPTVQAVYSSGCLNNISEFISTIMQERAKEELRKWYINTIGYDPFEDDPIITVEEVAKIKKKYIQEGKEEEGPK